MVIFEGLISQISIQSIYLFYNSIYYTTNTYQIEENIEVAYFLESLFLSSVSVTNNKMSNIRSEMLNFGMKYSLFKKSQTIKNE